MTDDDARSEDIREIRRILRVKPLQYVLILLSIVLALYGAALLVMTITVRTELASYEPFLSYYLHNPVLIMVVGSIFLVGLGSLGLVSSSQNLYQGVVTFGVLLFGLFMLKFTMGAVGFATLSSAKRSIKSALETHVDNYTVYGDSMDYVQSNLGCCGVSDFTDWNSTLGYIPGSCCNSESACGFADIQSLNLTGCYEALVSLTEYFVNGLILVLGILAAIEVLVMAITYYLARAMARKNQRRVSPSTSETSSGIPPLPEERKINNPMAMRANLAPVSNGFPDVGGGPVPEERDTRTSANVRYPAEIQRDSSLRSYQNYSKRQPYVDRKFPTKI